MKPCSRARGLECLWLLYKMTKLEKTKKKPTKTIDVGFFEMFSPSRNVHESLLALVLVNFEIKCFWPHGFAMKSKRRSDTLAFFSNIFKRKLKNNQLINYFPIQIWKMDCFACRNDIQIPSGMSYWEPIGKIVPKKSSIVSTFFDNWFWVCRDGTSKKLPESK
jgi:hypothetical protein